ncbi:MAG: ATP-binding protein [Marinilabiliaceae bacterium]|nr:ATP-binding protein [Bacteroidales bacterium]MDD5815463.1 ATP-binding protein [Bacteroidales bacterium]MDY4521354.1 ATP-binding protein [Bacteroidales bacterium]
MDSVNIEETLVLESEMNSISQVEKLIDAQAQMLNIDDEVYGKYMLSVVECVNNAIVHGNKMDKNKKVTMHYHISNTKIEVTVSDEGDGFDPDSLPDPTAEENLERDCGRGIFLMRHLSDELEFANNGRTITMKFNLQ